MDYVLTITNDTITGNTTNYRLEEPPAPPWFPEQLPGSVGSALKRTEWAGKWRRYRR